jgi:hypothetical protein
MRTLSKVDFTVEIRNGQLPELLDFWTFSHRPVFYRIKYTTFRKLDLFSSSGEGGPSIVIEISSF